MIENHALGFGAARLLRESNTVTYIRIHQYHLTQNEGQVSVKQYLQTTHFQNLLVAS